MKKTGRIENLEDGPMEDVLRNIRTGMRHLLHDQEHGMQQDQEERHKAADALLCRALVVLGEGDMVANYEMIRKWYA